VVTKTIIKYNDIMKFAGVWKNVSDERIKEMKESIKELKKRSTENLLK